MSRATVRLPSLPTSQPGMSSLIISTSSTTISGFSGISGISSTRLPFCSNRAICSCVSASTAAATAFICLPNFLPMVRKLHFTFFTRMPALSTNFTSFTFTSWRKIFFTLSIAARWVASTGGIIRVCRGCFTLIPSLRRRASTMVVTRWATSIRCSRSMSTSDMSASGNSSKWTESSLPPRSLYIRSEKNGANGAISFVSVIRHS